MAEKSEFENFKAARTANDDAGAVAAVADDAERIPLEEQADERGANPVEAELRQRFEEEHKSTIEDEKPEGEETPEQKLEQEKPEEEKPEEKPRGKHSAKARIEKLAKQKNEARTEAEHARTETEQARAEAAELRARIEALEKGKPPDRESTKEEVKQASREERVARLRRIEPKYDEVIKTLDSSVPQVVRETAQQLDNAPEVEFVLANLSPEEREDLARRTPETQRAIVRELSEELNKVHKGELAPEVAKARIIQQAAMQLENGDAIAEILQNDRSVGERLLAMPADKAVAAVKALNESLRTPKAVQEALVESENGEKIVEHLQKNPDVARKIGQMTPAQASREVVRLSFQLGGRAFVGGGREEASREKSRLPEPIKPIGGGSARSTVDPSDMDYQDWKKYRDSGGGR